MSVNLLQILHNQLELLPLHELQQIGELKHNEPLRMLFAQCIETVDQAQLAHSPPEELNADSAILFTMRTSTFIIVRHILAQIAMSITIDASSILEKRMNENAT
jgi:hypothetical protein